MAFASLELFSIELMADLSPLILQTDVELEALIRFQGLFKDDQPSGNGYACRPNAPSGASYWCFEARPEQVLELRRLLRELGLPEREPAVGWQDCVTANYSRRLRLRVDIHGMKGSASRTLNYDLALPVLWKGDDVVALGRLDCAMLSLVQMEGLPLWKDMAGMLDHRPAR